MRIGNAYEHFVYVCNFGCDYSSRFSSSMAAHYITVHTDEEMKAWGQSKELFELYYDMYRGKHSPDEPMEEDSLFVNAVKTEA